MTSIDVASWLPTVGAVIGFAAAIPGGYWLGGVELKQRADVVGSNIMAGAAAILLLILLAGVFVVNFDMVQPTLHAFGYQPVVAGLGAVVIDLAHALGAIIWVAIPHARRSGAVLTVMAAYISVLINLAGHAVVQETPRPGQPPLPDAANFAMLPTTLALPFFVVVVAHVAASVVGPVVERWQGDKSSAAEGDNVTTSTAEVVTEPAEVVTPEAPKVETPAEGDNQAANGGLAETQPMPRLVHSNTPKSQRPQEITNGRSGVRAPEKGVQAASGNGGGEIKAAMRAVWERHVRNGTTDSLTGGKLANEAGVGSRQIGGKYLTEWRAEVSTTGDNQQSEGDNTTGDVSTTGIEVVTDDNTTGVVTEIDNRPVASIA